MAGQRYIPDNTAQKAQLATTEIDLLDLAVNRTDGVRKAFVAGGAFDVLAIPLNVVPLIATATVIDATQVAAALTFKLYDPVTNTSTTIGTLAAGTAAATGTLTVPYGKGGQIFVEVPTTATVSGKVRLTVLYGQIGRAEEVHGA